MVIVRRSAQLFVGNTDIELIPSPCKDALESLIANVKAELHIVSPYITEAGTELITNRVEKSTHRPSIAVHLLTDLNPLSVCQGSCDPQAILELSRAFPRTRVLHLSRVHAKILVADRAAAIIGSANLTAGGIQDAYEYGIKVSSPRIASRIAEDVEEYSSLGATITADLLASYSQAAVSILFIKCWHTSAPLKEVLRIIRSEERGTYHEKQIKKMASKVRRGRALPGIFVVKCEQRGVRHWILAGYRRL